MAQGPGGHCQGDSPSGQLPDELDHTGKRRNASSDDALKSVLLGQHEHRQLATVQGSRSLPKSLPKRVPVIEADVVFQIVFVIEPQTERLQDLLKRCIMEGFRIDQNTITIEDDGFQQGVHRQFQPRVICVL
jgi:hypothetical protein